MTDTHTRPRPDGTDRPRPTMADLEHTPPYGGSVTDVWERGPGR